MEKQKGESLGVVIVESGWGSILPTVILAGMLNSGPTARSGKLSVGDQIMSINDTSLVGLPLATCQGIIKVWVRSSTRRLLRCLRGTWILLLFASGDLFQTHKRKSSPPTSVSATVVVVVVVVVVVCGPGFEESGEGETQHCELPSRHHCPHQET